MVLFPGIDLVVFRRIANTLRGGGLNTLQPSTGLRCHSDRAGGASQY